MTQKTPYRILIAEDNDISREMMASVLKTQNYDIIEARDGNESIEKIKEHTCDLALVDINMAPKGGFEFVQYLLAHNIKIPVVIITGDESSDMLIQANNLGVKQILQKPVLPDRLIHTVQRVFTREYQDGKGLSHGTNDRTLDHKGLMLRAIELALSNAHNNNRPFGAVIVGKDGHIISEGISGSKSYDDPTAYAEINAIRAAVNKLGRADLSGYSIYCSAEPTMLGKVLIQSVSITHVYYSLSQDDIPGLKEAEEAIKAQLNSKKLYEQIYWEEGIKAFSPQK